MMLAAHLGPVRGLVHRPEQLGAVGAFGAEPVLADLAAGARPGAEAEEGSQGGGDGGRSLSSALAGVDAVVCAVGAARPEDAEAVDYVGTVALIEAAREAGCGRFLLISSMGSDRPQDAPPGLRPFLEAKHEAERTLIASDLDWTIVRPGGLTDEEPTGRVRLAPSLETGGTVPRADVARVVTTALRLGAASRSAFDVVAGDTPIEQALQGLPSSSG